MKQESQTPKRTGGWSAIRRQLAEWPKPALLALIKDLHDASRENRDFLQARFDAEKTHGGSLENYRRKIIGQFFPETGYGKLKLGEARKAIRDYRKATGNTEGVIELLTTCLENGNEFTCEFGDINGPFYDSLCSVADELAGLLKREGPPAYAKVRERLLTVESKCSGMGWGYGDHISELMNELEEDLAE